QVSISIPSGATVYISKIDVTETHAFSSNVSSLYTGGGCTICSPAQTRYSGGGTDYVQTFYDNVNPNVPVTGMSVTSYGAICTAGATDTFSTLVDGVTIGTSSVNGGAGCACGLACGQYGFSLTQSFNGWGGFCG